MSEIELLYKNAGVEPEYNYFTAIKYPKIVQYFHLNKKELVDNIVDKIKYCKKNILIKVIRVDKDYPDFTAEKQIELIKWLINFDYTHLSKLYGADINFSVVLAATINYLWKCLSKSEQEQIRSILNGN